MSIEKLFVFMLNNSITAAWVILAVLALRLILRRCPKRYTCLLWLLPTARLVFPFSIESVVSLIPSAETVTPAILAAPVPTINSNIALVDGFVNPILVERSTPAVGASVNPMQVVMFAAGVIWLIGLALLILYTLISHLRLKYKLRDAVFAGRGIFLSDRISSPFVLGIVSPRIYLPFALDNNMAYYVLAHERAHIRRHDNVTKPLAFLLACVYWFNPAVWLAYRLFCRDIEYACDEAVITDLDAGHRKDYSRALIDCAVSNVSLISPLAFSETDVKERIKNVLDFKKPTTVITVTALVICILAGICLLTNPKPDAEPPVPVVTEDIVSDVADTPDAPEESFVPDLTVSSEFPLAGDVPEPPQPAQLEGEERARAISIVDRELHSLYELGILATDCAVQENEYTQVCIDDDSAAIFSPREPESAYSVRADLNCGGYLSVFIGAETEKISGLTIELYAAEGDTVLDRPPLVMGDNIPPELTMYYDCYYRIMDPQLTLGSLCDKLCAYWGFTGYDIPQAQECSFDILPTRDSLASDYIDKGYVTLNFDGDAPAAAMYCEMMYFPGRAFLCLGTHHTVG